MVDLFGELVVAVCPVSLEMLLWELVAFSASLLFFKELDYELQQTGWFLGYAEDKSVRGILVYRFLRVLLDALHHWWAGLALILYAPVPHLRWIGAGLLVADLPDFKRRFDDILRIVGENLSNTGG